MISADQQIQLEGLLAQIHAGLELTYGHCGESFRESGAEIQNSHLWALSDKVQECRELLGGGN